MTREPSRQVMAWAIFALTLALTLGLMPRVLQRLDPVTGDEPFYLMTAHNLLAGRGLDESRSWQNADYRAFYPPGQLPQSWRGWPDFPRVLPPHDSIGTVPPGMYSKHGLGLALIVAPAYALGGRAGAAVMMAIIGALTACNLFLLAWEASGRLKAALLVWAALAFSNPLLSYSFLIFPEIVAALLTVYAFRRIRSDSNSGWQTTGLAASVAFLPWLHARFVLLSLALFAYWFWKHFWSARRLSAWSLPPLILVTGSAGALLDYYYYLYRSFLPNSQDHGGFLDPLGALFASGGLLLDQQWGLLTYAPVYLAALAAALAYVRRSDKATYWWLAVVLPYLALVSDYEVWWGEWCPPARYLAALLPLFAAPLGQALARRPEVTPLFALLAGISWAEMGGFLVDPQRMYNQPDGVSRLFVWIHHLTGLDLTAIIPSFVQPAGGEIGNWLWYACVLAVALLWAALLGRSPGWAKQEASLSSL